MHQVWKLRDPRGFTAAELMVVVGLIGIVAAISVPSLFSYLQAMNQKAAAQELAVALARARELAITSNQFVCVETSAGRVRFRTGPTSGAVCGGGTIWKGTGTDTNGWMAISGNLDVTMIQNPIFSSLGAAAQTGSFSVSNPCAGSPTPVTVAATGRIRVGN